MNSPEAVSARHPARRPPPSERNFRVFFRSTLPRACERLIADLTGEVGAKAAVSWAHAAALVEHATAHGLVAALRQGDDGPDHTRHALGALAGSHPALEPLTDPQVLPLWENPISPAGWKLIARLWSGAPIRDDGHRIDGYRLGDAYQALSADARKSRALCQTLPGSRSCCSTSPSSRRSTTSAPTASG